MNKKIVGVALAAILVLTIGAVGTYLLFSRRGDEGFEFHLNCDLPRDVNTTLHVYRLVPEEITEDEFLQVAGSLGMNGTATVNPDQPGFLLSVREGEYVKSLEYYSETGVFIYSDESVLSPSPPPQDRIPTANETREIAVDFMKSLGFWRENMTFSAFGEDVMGIGTKDGGGGEEWVLSRTVYFTENLSGYPIVGAGARITVTVGVDGVIGGFTLSRRNYVVVGVVKVISPETAYERLKEGRQLEGLWCVGGVVYVKNVHLAYYISSLLEGPGEILPCYVFEGVLEDGVEVQFYVSATE